VINFIGNDTDGAAPLAKTFSSIRGITHDAASSVGRLGLFTRNGSSFSEDLSIVKGNVGIGTTNPDEMLHISGVSPNIKLTDTNTSLSSLLYADTGAASLMIVSDVTGGGTDPFISFRIKGISIANEKMRIDSSGKVGIGTTNPIVTLDVRGTGQAIRGYRSTTNSLLDLFTLSSDVGGTSQTKFKIEADGKAYTGSTLLSSDDRLKHNEQEIFGALETLSKITPKKYIKTSNLYEPNHDFQLDEDGNPIDENGKPIAHHIEAGVIAQQVLDVPELQFLVREERLDADGNTEWPYSLDYNSLFTYAIAAIQEQQQLIDNLKSQNESLAAQNADFESRISQLEQ
jgi:hypothetical protein